MLDHIKSYIEHGVKKIIFYLEKILRKLDDPRFGLKEIKKEIIDIEKKLDNPWFGLKEIKKEIKDIENGMACPVRSTGPAIRSAGVGNLYVKLQNDTDVDQMVLVEVRSLDTCPKTVAASETVNVPANCAVLRTFDIGPSGLDLEEFEVRITTLSGEPRAIQAFVAGAEGQSVNLNPANTWRDAELVCKFDSDNHKPC